MIAIMTLAGLVVGTNFFEYNFVFKNKMPVQSCVSFEAILPNGDRVQIPSFNGRVPVIYIQSTGLRKSDLVLDFDDESCKPIGSSKTFSYQNNDISKQSFLDTFSSIQKQIDSMNSINKKDGEEQSKLLMSLSKDIKELSKDIKELSKGIKESPKESPKELPNDIKELPKDIKELKSMVTNTQQNIAISKQNEQELSKSFNDIKSMIFEVRKELVGIQQKLASQTSKPHDIIEPNLPVLDKAGVSGTK
jgi:peptidoglycan hydrolase CwlO-like protein